MFETNKQRQAAREKLWKALSRMHRGDVLDHETAEAILGISRGPGSPYYKIMQKTSLRMEEERGIALVSIPMVGHLLGSIKDMLEAGRNRSIRATRQTRRGYRTVACIPVDECNPIEAKAKFGMEEKLAAAERAGRSQAQLMAFLLRPRGLGMRIADEREESEHREEAG